MADSKQRLRDEMLCGVPPNLRDRFVTGSVDVSPHTLGLLFSLMYFSPQNKGLVASLCKCTREAIELFAEPMQKELPEPMQLDSCLIRLYSNVAGQANYLEYHQDGNQRYTRVLIKVNSSGEIRSVVCFRRIGSQEEEFTIQQRSCTYYGGYPDVMTKNNVHGLEHSVPAMSASGEEQTTAVIALDWLPAKAGATGLWTKHRDTLSDMPASSMPAQNQLYSRSILWHGQQITLRIMRLDCFCGLTCKVYVHMCSTSECNSQLCLRVAVVFWLCENLI